MCQINGFSKRDSNALGSALSSLELLSPQGVSYFRNLTAVIVVVAIFPAQLYKRRRVRIIRTSKSFHPPPSIILPLPLLASVDILPALIGSSDSESLQKMSTVSPPRSLCMSINSFFLIATVFHPPSSRNSLEFLVYWLESPQASRSNP